MGLRFEGRVALVTGGGRGIGAATCACFAEDGADIAVADIDIDAAREVAAAIETLGNKAVAVECDVTQRSSVEATVQQTVAILGSIDYLVCCAGIIRDNLIHRMTDDEWDAVIDTHLKGAFLTAQAVQRHMVRKRYGKIVLLSSTAARGNRGQANYSAAKAGLEALARTLAIELGAYNINVNGVAPGFVDTRMTRGTADRMGVDWDKFRDAAVERIPLKRIGQPRDLAHVICFLCSEDASFVSGQTICVRGGP